MNSLHLWPVIIGRQWMMPERNYRTRVEQAVLSYAPRRQEDLFATFASLNPKIGKKFKMLYFKEYFIEYTQRLNQFVTIFRNNDWHHIPRIILK